MYYLAINCPACYIHTILWLERHFLATTRDIAYMSKNTCSLQFLYFCCLYKANLFRRSKAVGLSHSSYMLAVTHAGTVRQIRSPTAQKEQLPAPRTRASVGCGCTYTYDVEDDKGLRSVGFVQRSFA